MTAVAFALVLCSALSHSAWNFLLKRSEHKTAFLGSATAVAFSLLLIPALVIAVVDGVGTRGLMLGSVTAGLHAVYGSLLSRGYRHGDLSIVYPVSRGMGPSLIPIGATLLLGEHISAIAIIGIILILIGVYAINIEPHALGDLLQPFRSVNTQAGRAALLTGVVIAAYSLWDKNALGYLPPVPLNQFGMTGLALTLVPFGIRGGGPFLREEWEQRALSILVAGVLIPIAYLLVLVALTTSRVSYIGPAREVGIVFGTVLGVMILREGYRGLRIPASILIVAGVLTLALSP